MPKPELEFFDPSPMEWQEIEGSGGMIHEKIVSLDPDTGDYTRVLEFKPGTRTTETLVHDFWEEVWIVSGVCTTSPKSSSSRPGTTPAGLRACCTVRTTSPTGASPSRSGTTSSPHTVTEGGGDERRPLRPAYAHQ